MSLRTRAVTVMLLGLVTTNVGCVCGPKMIDPCTGRVLNPLPRIDARLLAGPLPLGCGVPVGCAAPVTCGCAMPVAAAPTCGCQAPVGCQMPAGCEMPTGCQMPVGCEMPTGCALPSTPTPPSCGCGLPHPLGEPVTAAPVTFEPVPPQRRTVKNAPPAAPPVSTVVPMRFEAVTDAKSSEGGRDYGFDAF